MIYQTTGTIWACKTWGEAKTIKLCNQPWWAWSHTLYFNAFTVQRPKHILVGCFYYSAAFLLFARATISSFQKLGTCPFFSPRNWACVGTTKFPTKTSLMLFLTLGLIVLFQCNNSAQEILYIEAALCSPHVTVPHAPAWTILLSLITAKCTFQITSASFHQG